MWIRQTAKWVDLDHMHVQSSLVSIDQGEKTKKQQKKTKTKKQTNKQRTLDLSKKV